MGLWNWFIRNDSRPELGSTQEPSVSDEAGSDDTQSVDGWDRIFVLALDGGGIRGLSSLFILRSLMRTIGEVEREHDVRATHSFYPNDWVQPRGSTGLYDDEYSHRYLPCHYFDVIAGTSTGGLIAIMLGRLRMSVSECIHEYVTFGSQIFGRPRRAHLRGKLRTLQFNPFKDKYKVGPLRKAVQRIVDERDPSTVDDDPGVHGTPSQLATPSQLTQTMVWAVEGSGNQEGWIFRSFEWPVDDHLFQRSMRTHTYTITQVACATTAAPTYFKPFRVNDLVFMDGGLTANNPCYNAIFEIKDYLRIRHGENAADRGYLGAAVSIGTGHVEQKSLPKPSKRWLGRYKEAAGWEKRRAQDSAINHRKMTNLASEITGHLRDRGIPDGSPLQFRYDRLTVGEHAESPDNARPLVTGQAAERVKRMAGMKMDEWRTEPAEATTIRKIEEATRAYVNSTTVQQKMRELAEFLVTSRRKRAQCDQLASAARQPSSEGAQRWYRYANACEWHCEKCVVGTSKFSSLHEVRQHIHGVHGAQFSETDSALKRFCSGSTSQGPGQ